MSEYQYYEFQAIDRALTQQEQDQISGLSSRVQLSPHRAVFTYSYSSFRGDPERLLAQCFDAFLYLANWGSRWLYFRFPAKLVPAEALTPFCVDEFITVTKTAGHTLLGVTFEEQDGDWLEGEGLLGPMLALRQHIIEGDYRALYLAWLGACKCLDEEENHDGDEDAQASPPLPAGLRNLSAPHSALIEFLNIDADLITSAATHSSDATAEPELEPWLDQLPQAERDDFLRQLLRGEPALAMQLRLRLKAIAAQHQPIAAPQPAKPQFRLSDLRQQAEDLANERILQAGQAKEVARLKKLETIAAREIQLWHQAANLIALKKTKAYSDSIDILKSLQDLAKHRNQLSAFNVRVRSLQLHYSSLSSFRQRLEVAGLLSSNP